MQEPVQVFTCTIINDKRKLYQLFAYGIIILNMITQLLFDYQHTTKNISLNIIVYVVVLLLLIGWDVYLIKNKKQYQSLGIIILLLGFRWFQLGYQWPFFINLILWALYIASRRKLNIYISPAQVEYPSLPVRKMQWSEISNLVLKDGILTIDGYNNKLYQHYISDITPKVSEAEFNDFCSKQLVK